MSPDIPAEREQPAQSSSGGPSIRVLIADDLPLLRLGFRLVLDAQDDIQVVGEASNGAEAVARSTELRPDVILMDVRMPVLDGITATRQIIGSGSAARVVILTTFDLDEYAFAALHAGASGFLLKDTQPADLISAVRLVASGDAVIAPRMTRRLLETYLHPTPAGTAAAPAASHDPRLDTLTSREREVLTALAEGLSNSEIAARFVLAETTVKSHVGRVLTKLDLRDRVQAVVYAYENGLTRPLPRRVD